MKNKPKFLTLSGLEPFVLTPNITFVNVGEMTNVTGSRKFLRIIKDNNLSIVTAAWIGFAASFLLGSSSRFAAFTAILASIFGVEFLPLFFAIDYTGYMLSPTHKCFAIGKMYFNTSFVTYYTHIILLCSLIIAVAVLLVA